MTVFLIKKGIIKTLRKAFDNLPVYAERVEQGFSRPSFFVFLKTAGGKRELGQRRRKSAEFDIQYFPAAGEKQNEDMYAMGDELLELFEEVETDSGVLRPAEAMYEIEDDVLHVSFSVCWFTRKEKPAAALVSKIDTEVLNGR
ncbi:MAG: hypothetical protein PHT34_04995 [Oscillospiraceae bacterium]|nr:hypothetical protein [Oscillospiraceae bacterium]